MADPSALSRSVAAAADLRLEAVSSEVRSHAARVVADTMGVSLGGGQRSEIKSFVRGNDPLFAGLGEGVSELLVPGFPRTDPATAAFVNATAGTFLELDEGCRPTGHPAMHVVPAALAAAQALHTTGRAFLSSVLVGYEVTARLFEAYRLTYPVHPHGHFGAVGAAVAVAKLRGVDPVEPAKIAATLPLLSVWQPCFEGATVRNAYTGAAAATGLNANRMAEAGFTGSEQAQQVAFGELVGRLVKPEALTEPVDPDHLRITRNYLKLHSACALTHSALDAILALGPPPAEDVSAVKVETVSNSMKIARRARPNDLSTRFSLPYAVAAAIVHGDTAPETFAPDDRVAELAERVQVSTAEDLEELWPDAAPARVTVYLREEVLSHRTDNPHGHHADPALPGELRGKFRMLVGDDSDTLYEKLLDIENVEDMAGLIGSCA